MRTLVRRETFIALRARRQGHRIASEIINPSMVPDPPPLKVLPYEQTNWFIPLAYQRGHSFWPRRPFTRGDIVLFIIALNLLGLSVMFAIFWRP